LIPTFSVGEAGDKRQTTIVHSTLG